MPRGWAVVLDAMEKDQRQLVLEGMADEMHRREREHYQKIKAPVAAAALPLQFLLAISLMVLWSSV